MQPKNLSLVAVAALCALTLAACGKQAETQVDRVAMEAKAKAEAEAKAVEAAAKEEGKVVVYASSSRIEDQIEIWNSGSLPEGMTVEHLAPDALQQPRPLGVQRDQRRDEHQHALPPARGDQVPQELRQASLRYALSVPGVALAVIGGVSWSTTASITAAPA